MPRDERDPTRSAEIEALRILREYRRLVLVGRARLPLAEARRLLGPDCAFHLYFRHEGAPTARGSKPRRRRAAKGRPRGRG